MADERDLPDLDTISTLLTVVETRDPRTASVSRLDEDHSVLLRTQAEVVDLLASDLPSGYDDEGVRAVLRRIVNDIERNRDQRQEAASEESRSLADRDTL